MSNVGGVNVIILVFIVSFAMSYCQKLVTVVFRRRVRSAFLRP